MKAFIPGIAFLVTACATSQSPQATASKGPASQSSPAGATTSSNPLVSLPTMSVDRCTALDVGTGPDAKTGAPVRVSVDPKSGAAGNTICPPKQPVTDPKPPK